MRFAWHRHSPTAQRARAATPRVIPAHRHLEPLLTTLLACLPQVRSVADGYSRLRPGLDLLAPLVSPNTSRRRAPSARHACRARLLSSTGIPRGSPRRRPRADRGRGVLDAIKMIDEMFAARISCVACVRRRCAGARHGALWRSDAPVDRVQCGGRCGRMSWPRTPCRWTPSRRPSVRATCARA